MKTDINQIPTLPHWPKDQEGTRYLCLIRARPDGKREYGFLLQGSWDLNLGYIMDGGTGEIIHYAGPEEIAKDGWTID